MATFTLQTRFGRRMVALFVTSALLPIAALAAIGYAQVKGQLVEQTRAQLSLSAKSAGMALFDQLRVAREAFASAAARGTTPANAGAIFDTLIVEPAEARDSAITLVVTRAGGQATVWMVGPLAGGRRLRAAITPSHLFAGARERAVIGSDGRVCVSEEAGAPIDCTPTGGEAELIESRPLFLAYEYGTPPWHVAVAQPLATALAPVLAFRRTFLATVIAALGFIVFLSVRQVRKSLVPLQALQSGTRRIAERDFSAPVRVSSNDEFEDLAGSFNAMGSELDQQFRHNAQLIERLEQLSYGALAALARTIDASSPWTAGHSERVTSFSLRMAAHLGLDASAVDALRRGGLLHDIGKIGISPTILDKPGALDTFETARIREHPTLGARILAPLEAFADAIPVVMYHHERFDGAGYPRGLKGEEIPLLARLLSVADVYDALVSSRPYRPGWEPAVALATIKASSGTQFDPAMVDAFFAVMDLEGDAARFAVVEAVS